MEEVAPAQLSDERLRTGPVVNAVEHLERGKAAEVEVGRHPGRPVGGEVVVELPVPPEAGAPPRGEPRARCRLTARGQLGGLDAAREPVERPQAVGAARRRQPRGRPLDGSPRRLPPTAVVRREDAEMPTLRRAQRIRRDDGDAREEAEADPCLVRRPRQPVLTSLGVRADIGGREDRLCADGARGRNGLLHHVTASQREERAPRAQGAVEIDERLAQECEPVRSREVRVEDPVVEDEERHHPLGLACRCREGRMVVHPQVAGEEDDDAAHG